MKKTTGLLFLLFCFAPLSAQIANEGGREIVRNFIRTVEGRDRRAISKLVHYPLKRGEKPAIGSKSEFIARFDEIFDENILHVMAKSDPTTDWSEVGWRGFMLFDGAIWLDSDGGLIAVNYQADSFDDGAAMRMLEEFYVAYLTLRLDRDLGSDRIRRSRQLQQKYVTADLLDRIENDEMPDCDPFVQAQDVFDDWLETIEVTATNSADPVFTVTLKRDAFLTDARVEITLLVVKEDGKYKIGDILPQENNASRVSDFENADESNGDNVPITVFQPDDGTIPADSIRRIEETCLITVLPPLKQFEDENSDEAEAYFIAMDDWVYYTWELGELFESLGVKTAADTNRRYLSFELADGKRIVVDTEQRQNGRVVNALLYRKGRIPLFLNLIPGDNDRGIIEDYLQAK